MKSHFLGFVLASFLGLALVAGCSSSSTPAAAATCTNSGASSCASGSALQACVTKNGDGSCSGIYYTIGSQTFPCNSCTDTTSCAASAVSACAGDAGGFDFDSGTPDNLDSGATPG
jgi:hypothetical protein